MARALLSSLVAITVAPMGQSLNGNLCCMLCHIPSDSCHRNFSLDKDQKGTIKDKNKWDVRATIA